MSYPSDVKTEGRANRGGPKTYRFWTEDEDEVLVELYHARVNILGEDYYLPMSEIGRTLGRTAQSCLMRRVVGPLKKEFTSRPTGCGSVLKDRPMIESLRRNVVKALEKKGAVSS